MKKLLFLLCFILTVPAYAEMAKLEVGTFAGKLLIDNKLDIEKVEVELHHQFCNIWNTTCAGGPSDTVNLVIVDRENSDGSISFSHEGEQELSSFKLGNRFSSCTVNLKIEAINQEGRTLFGSQNLAWINDKKVCGAKNAITEKVRKSLAKPFVVKDGGVFISIK